MTRVWMHKQTAQLVLYGLGVFSTNIFNGFGYRISYDENNFIDLGEL